MLPDGSICMGHKHSECLLLPLVVGTVHHRRSVFGGGRVYTTLTLPYTHILLTRALYSCHLPGHGLCATTVPRPMLLVSTQLQLSLCLLPLLGLKLQLKLSGGERAWHQGRCGRRGRAASVAGVEAAGEEAAAAPPSLSLNRDQGQSWSQRQCKMTLIFCSAQ